MANVKITDLAALTNPASTDVLPIVDVDTDVTKKVSVGEIVGKISGDVTVGTDGTAAITGGVIVNADVNASAAIAGTKINPDFGSQTVETTGVINAGSGTAAAPAVTVGTTDNGLYSPGADQVAISTNGTGRLFVDASGNVGVNTTSPGAKLDIVETDVAQTPNAGSPLVIRRSEGASINLLSGNTQTSFVLFGDTESAQPGRIGYSHTDDSLLFVTAGNEKARIDSSGRLLVGTSTASTVTHINPTAGPFDVTPTLQVNSTGATTLAITSFRSSSDDTGPQIAFIRGSQNGSIIPGGADTVLGALQFFGEDGNDTKSIGGRIACEVDGTPGADDMPGRLVFSTTADGASSPTERMRITSGGEVWINATTGNIGTTTFGTAISSGGNIGLFYTSRNVSGGGTVAGFFGNAGVLLVKGDGDCENTNNSYTGTSDIKLKENIVDANSQWDDLKALQVRNYNFKAETGYNTHTQIGLIAQEVELVSPGLVGESIDEETGESTKSVNYSVLYMKAVKALQEAMERIETLEAKVAALETS